MLKYHITVREFLAIVIAIETLPLFLSNKRIQIQTDTMAVVHIINNHTSKDIDLMILMRRLMVNILKYNILFQAIQCIHIPGLNNIAADKLSRLQVDDFHSQFPHMDTVGICISQDMMIL